MVEDTASRLSLLQRHREARELLVKIQCDEHESRAESRAESQPRRPRSAASAAQCHFKAVASPAPQEPERKRPVSALPKASVPVTRRPATACGVREHFREVKKERLGKHGRQESYRNLMTDIHIYTYHMMT